MSETPILSPNAALEAIFDLTKLPNAPTPRFPDGCIRPDRVVPRVVELNNAYHQVLQQRDTFRARVAELGGDFGANDYGLPELKVPVRTPKPVAAPDGDTRNREIREIREILLAFSAMGDKLHSGMDRFLCSRLEASMDREAELIRENLHLKDTIKTLTSKDPR